MNFGGQKRKYGKVVELAPTVAQAGFLRTYEHTNDGSERARTWSSIDEHKPIKPRSFEEDQDRVGMELLYRTVMTNKIF